MEGLEAAKVRMQFHRGVEDAMGEGTRGREEEGLVWVPAEGWWQASPARQGAAWSPQESEHSMLVPTEFLIKKLDFSPF